MTTTDLTIPGATGAVSLIQQTALELTAAHQIATAIAGTSFVPQHFRGKPDEIAVAILYGATIDFDPVTAVQQIYVIGGKPALYARAMVAVVLSKGHAIWVEDEEPGKVTVAGRRKGTEQVQRITWTTEDARRAGYTSNRKYETDPRSMLYARASGDIARRIAPDALMGLAYSVEELELGDIPAVAQVPSERSGVSRLRAAVPAAESAPQALPRAADAAEVIQDADVVDDQGESVPEVDGVTSAQLKKLGAMMRAAGITERDHALRYVSDVIGREVASRNELTKDEAHRVIEALESDTDWPPVAEVGGAA